MSSDPVFTHVRSKAELYIRFNRIIAFFLKIVGFYLVYKAYSPSLPETDLVAISSPIALIKNSANQENGKLLYDYILSEEGQKILSEHGCASIRDDVQKEGSLSPSEIAKRAMKIDDAEIAKHSGDVLAVFDKIFK